MNRIHTKARNRMTPDKAMKLVYIYINQRKLAGLGLEEAWLETYGLEDEELVQWENQAVYEGYTYAHNDLTELLEGVKEEVDKELAEEEDEGDIGMTI